MSEQIQLIAQRIRDLREISEISAEDMAKSLNIPVETYRAYEEGGTDIPISVLYEAAGRFGVDLTEILSGDAPKLNIYQVVKNGKGLEVKRREQYRYHNLAYNFHNKKIEPFLVEVPYLGEDLEVHENSHPGQEYNYVLEGELAILINGKEERLTPGDSIYFNSAYPHGMRAMGGKSAKFLAIILN